MEPCATPADLLPKHKRHRPSRRIAHSLARGRLTLAPSRLAQAQFVQHGCEQLPIFRYLDAFGLCAQNWDACSLQSTRQVQRGLTTELDEHAFGFLLVANVEHVFEGERLEVELVTSVVIG